MHNHSIFHHIGYDVRDLKKSTEFFEKALAPLGMKMILGETGLYSAFGKRTPEFWLGQGSPTNGRDEIHVAFMAETRAQVKAFYEAALAAGGTDNGSPGLRPEYREGYYAAFVFDPDGNNIEAVCMTG